MLPAILLAAALTSKPAPPTNPEAYGAIFDDLTMHALIGNSARGLNSEWIMGHDTDHPPELRIAALRCRTHADRAHCRFELIRKVDDHSAELVADRAGPPRLLCHAELRFSADGDGGPAWGVHHKPPLPRGGHSRTTLGCVRP
jgi:hypothetical protein